MNIRTISQNLKEKYGKKVYKLSLQTGCSCPNRDGTLGTGGCIFCSAGGSGDFAAPHLPIKEQIAAAKARVAAKVPADAGYIAYFQSFTNTYGDTGRLLDLFSETLRLPEILEISIATRPDCLKDDMLRGLSELNRIRPVTIELGLQTAHDHTAETILRGYPLSVYGEAMKKLRAAGLETVVHMILGLPGEQESDILSSMACLSEPSFRPDGIKLQLLHVLKGTRLGSWFSSRIPSVFPELSSAPDVLSLTGNSPLYRGGFTVPGDREIPDLHIYSLEEYTALVVKCLQALPEDICIHRITGDGPKALLLSPLWSADKKRVLNTLNRAIREA